MFYMCIVNSSGPMTINFMHCTSLQNISGMSVVQSNLVWVNEENAIGYWVLISVLNQNWQTGYL